MYTSSCDFAHTCVFDKQSLLPFLCDPQKLHPQGFHSQGHTLSRSYGIKLPSSLTKFHPIALGYSPHSPVSVYGTGDNNHTTKLFLEAWLGSLLRLSRSFRASGLCCGFAYNTPCTLTPQSNKGLTLPTPSLLS